MLLFDFLFIKLVLIAGLAIWNILEAWGLIRDFNGAEKMVGRIMSMQLLTEPPKVPSNLMIRRVEKACWHRFGVFSLVVLNGATALACVMALFFFCTKGIGGGDFQHFLQWSNLALVIFLSMGFLLSFVGTWFAHYIKQMDLMLLHLVLIVMGSLIALIINLPAGP